LIFQANLGGSTNTNREIDAKAWWTAFRDLLRNALPSPAFLVGDIFRWQGIAGRFGHGFLIRHISIFRSLILKHISKHFCIIFSPRWYKSHINDILLLWDYDCF
jgi:hypothetical protein